MLRSDKKTRNYINSFRCKVWEAVLNTHFCIQNFLENGTISMFSGQLKDKENSSSETFEDSALLNLPF